MSPIKIEELYAKIEAIKSSLGENTKSLIINLIPSDRGTEVQITDKLHAGAGGIFGGLVGGLGLGAGLGVGFGVGIAVVGSPLFMMPSRSRA